MLDFSAQKLQLNAFSTLPSNLIDMPKIGPLAPVLAMDLLENGDAAARNAWVNQQVFNLLTHARAHSKFWAARLDRKAPNNLARAPVFRRQELSEQVLGEGCLPLSGQHRHAKPHLTSGSTGIASRFFISDMNAAYNGLRGAAQYLFDGRSLEFNRVSFTLAKVDDKKGYAISHAPHWAGPLAEVFRNGSLRTVNFQFPDFAQLGEELLRKPCGYFNALPSFFLALRDALGQENFLKLQIKEFVSKGQHIPAEARDLCRESGIHIRDTYSCEEVGPIAFECSAIPGAFHVATSNVVVECEEPLLDVDGERVGKLLITHLHSYATPFIRYEIGDLGALAPECACGHRGPTVTRLHGRLASLLRHRNGPLTSFLMPEACIDEILPAKEFRVRQTALDRMVIEIIPLGETSEKAVEGIANLLRDRFGAEFEVDVKIVDRIDWGGGYKRLMFRCEI
jgi:phenylacetate-coenzyme A ligase PaaK-like adenylate-forming protein